MSKLRHLAVALAVLSLASGIAVANAAEKGTRAMNLPATHPLRSLPPTHPLRSGHMYNYQPRTMYNYAAPHRYHNACPSGRC
jgi:hypothetical protein